MSLATKDTGKKWIQTSVAVLCGLLVYIFISFFMQMGEWFELESKVPAFVVISQVLAVFIGLGIFVYLMKNDQTRTFLEEVYQEGIKVVWPDKNETVKHTIGIMIGVTIVGVLLAVFDVTATWLLSLIN
jgi:preprotein translocase subunit SecE